MQSDHEPGVQVVCCVYDETSRVRGDDRVTEYNAQERIDQMKDYVRDALVGASIGNAVVRTMESEYDTVDQFPFVTVSTVYTVSEPVTIGTDPLA